jgi:sporulation protein YabP
MTEENSIKQKIVISDRSDVVIDKVETIVSFDDTYVVLATDGGRINIEGSELKVDSLTKEDGKIHILGNISGVFYSGDVKRGGFSKFFK